MADVNKQLIQNLYDQISSLKEIVHQLQEEKKQMMAQQSQVMQVLLQLQAKLEAKETSSKQQQKVSTNKPSLVASKINTQAIPSSGPGSSTASSIHASPKPISYAKVAAKHLPAKPKKKKPISINTVQRVLSVSTGPSTYNFVYLPCRHHLKHSNVRRLLSSLKIIQSRILDVQFPARGVVALLVHQAYHQELVDSLTKAGVKPINNFDPLAPTVIGDPKHASLSAKDKSNMAKDLLVSRLLRTCLRLPVHLGNSVARYFAQSNGIVQIPADAHSKYLADRKAGTAPLVQNSQSSEQARSTFTLSTQDLEAMDDQ